MSNNSCTQVASGFEYAIIESNNTVTWWTTPAQSTDLKKEKLYLTENGPRVRSLNQAWGDYPEDNTVFLWLPPATGQLS